MTAEQSWPGLGFDPAPGDRAKVNDLAERLATAARTLSETYRQLHGGLLVHQEWTGMAADAFASRVKFLPEYLAQAEVSLGQVRHVLMGWETLLAGYQTRRQALEQSALAAHGQVKTAEQEYQRAAADPALTVGYRFYPDEAQARAAEQRHHAAREALLAAAARVGSAQQALSALVEQAKQLLDEHESQAGQTAERIHSVIADFPRPSPTWVESVEQWFKDNLETIGDVAGLLAAIAGALAFIPVLTPFMGPLAVLLGLVALGAHAGDMAVNDKWDDPNAWVTLGGDVLGIVPGLGAIGKGVGAAGDAFRTVDGLGEVGRVGFAAFAKRAAGDSGEAAFVFEKLGGAAERLGGNAELVAKVSQSSVGLTLQAPTVASWCTDDEKVKGLKDGAGVVGAGLNGGQALSKDGWDKVKGFGGWSARMGKALV